MDKSFWKNQKTVVTGGSGFLGRWLVRSLADMGAKIEIWDIAAPTNLDIEYTFKKINLEDLDAVIKIVQESQAEIIIHLAGQAGVSACHKNPVEAYNRNVLSTFNILEACRVYGKIKSLVAASSNHVYGDQEIMPTKEDANLNGLGMYAVSKLCADLLASAYGKTYQLPVGIARITNSFGGDDPHTSHIITGSILSALKQENPVIKQSGKDVKGYLYVKDTVEGFLKLAEKIATSTEVYGESFNFVPDDSISVKDLVLEIINVVGTSVEPEIHAASAEYETEHLDNKKARNILGWKPQYTLNEGLKETVSWYQQNYFSN